MTKEACPLEEGDRVDHKIFGFGTVSGAPVAVVGPGGRNLMEIVDKGWQVPITWDDPTRPDGRVGHAFLTKVSSPDARPFAYWNRQWQPLLQAWKAARRSVEEASATFRPLPEEAELTRLRNVEAAAFQALQAFVDDERSGGHG